MRLSRSRWRASRSCTACWSPPAARCNSVADSSESCVMSLPLLYISALCRRSSLSRAHFLELSEGVLPTAPVGGLKTGRAGLKPEEIGCEIFPGAVCYLAAILPDRSVAFPARTFDLLVGQ